MRLCLTLGRTLCTALLLASGARAAALDDLQAFIRENRLKTVSIEVRGPDDASSVKARGSGVLIAGGHVLTSLALIGGPPANAAALRLSGRIGYTEATPELKLAYVDHAQAHDLVLLRFDPDTPTVFAASCVRRDEPAIGERLAVLGFPLGAFGFSEGTVSGLAANKISTRAPIADGNKGSPAFDQNGRLIGLVRGEEPTLTGPSGIVYIVPISRARNLIDQTPDDDACAGVPARRSVEAFPPATTISSLSETPRWATGLPKTDRLLANFVDQAAGRWSGVAREPNGFEFRVDIELSRGCALETSCGSISVPHIPCRGRLRALSRYGYSLEFGVDMFDSASDPLVCKPGGGEMLELRSKDALLYKATYSGAQGVLQRAY